MAKSSNPPVFCFHSHQIRTVIEGEQIWFAAVDVCRALDISWSGRKILRGFPDDWQRVVKLTTLRRGEQQTAIISEPAVYKLAFRSNKPEADVFTNWVASEVLPTIRKTGKYEAKPAPKQKALPAAKPKTLPVPMPEVTREKLPLPYPFPKEKIDVLLSQVSYHMLKIKHAEQDITEIMTAEYLRHNPGAPDTLKDRRYAHNLYLSCSAGSLWQSIDFALKAIEESVNLRLETCL